MSRSRIWRWLSPRNVVGLLILLAVLAVGAAAYKIADSEGVDPSAAGVEATRAGERQSRSEAWSKPRNTFEAAAMARGWT